jgi:hypothetical protein
MDTYLVEHLLPDVVVTDEDYRPLPGDSEQLFWPVVIIASLAISAIPLFFAIALTS